MLSRGVLRGPFPVVAERDRGVPLGRPVRLHPRMAGICIGTPVLHILELNVQGVLRISSLFEFWVEKL